MNFVGPYTGTTRLPPEQPPGFPSVSAPVAFDAAYRNGIGFDSDHFAQWGRQAAQAKNDIRAQVAEYRPDYLLVELGFNDLGWGVSAPDGLIADMMTIIAEARFSNPAIRILVANVVHRTLLPNVPTLPQITEQYNSKLGPMLSLVNSAQSPVRLVDIDAAIVPSLDTSDGLHPNGVGEFRIARAFANVLASQFSVGQAFGGIPASVPDLVPAAPASMTATPTPIGIDVRWAHSFGAAGYWLHQRDATAGTAFERLPLPIPADSWPVGWVQTGHRYEYYVVPMRGFVEGAASAVGSAVANPVTAAGPTNIIVTPSTSFVDFSWTRPTGPFSDTVNGYLLYYYDQNAFGAIVQQQRVNSTSYRLSGLVSGHRYTFVVASINASGAGFPSAGPEAILGFGRPGASTITSAKIFSPTDVELRWAAVPGATSYIILSRDFVAGAPFTRAAVVTGTSQTFGCLFPGSERWEWCVIAANGSLEGPTSACVHSQGSI